MRKLLKLSGWRVLSLSTQFLFLALKLRITGTPFMEKYVRKLTRKKKFVTNQTRRRKKKLVEKQEEGVFDKSCNAKMKKISRKKDMRES